MLTQDEATMRKRNPRRERRLWHDGQNTPSLGCLTCRDKTACGGLSVTAGFYDCLQFCCGKPNDCDRVCRNHPEYADRVREVTTFDLENVPRTEPLIAPALPRTVPLVFHASGRVELVESAAVALPLYCLFDRWTGKMRFLDRGHLCSKFRIAPGTTILLTGVNRDPPLERWWGYGEGVRRKIIRSLKTLGIGIVTVPNYSLFLNRPRWDDLFAMKRIAIVHQEFLSQGLPAALHVNGRTDRDFERWGDYIASRPEIAHIAYEFTTGTGWGCRRYHHAKWLAGLASRVRRPLHLIIRGGTEVLPALVAAFEEVTVIDSSVFMKTMKRQRAVATGNVRVGWRSESTARGAPLDRLFAENLSVVSDRNSIIASSAVLKRTGTA